MPQLATDQILLSVHTEDDYLSYEVDQASHHTGLLKSIIVPRPIALVTTIGKNGVVNAAPFSFFNLVCSNPPIVAISVEQRRGELKDTSRNILDNKEFVVNICSTNLAKEVTVTSYDFPRECSEIKEANLSLIASEKIAVPRIANTKVQIECVLEQSLLLGNSPTDLILGRVVKIHTRKELLDEHGYVDMQKLDPLARLGGTSFARVNIL